MIRTEEEYKKALERVEDEDRAIELEKERLISQGISPEHADIALESYRTFTEQLRDEVREYEKMRKGEIDNIRNFGGIGRKLILLRIYRNMTQKDLADKIGVSPQQVCRDEKNEYHNAGMAKLSAVLEALGVRAETTFKIEGEAGTNDRKLVSA